jgi:polysaccharide chain length determinant protein (PEP-CTERM system associated)
MDEIFEQINHYKWVLIHHRWFTLISAILICIGGWTTVQFIPDKYQSETRVYIDTETALKSLLTGIAVDNNVLENAASVIERTLLARPNLERLINETDLKLKIVDTDPLQVEKLLGQLASDTKITSVSLGGRNESRNIYRITYSHTDPKLAKDVVDALLNMFVETILGTSRKDTFSAQQFLDEQIKLYDQKQVEAEENLKQFKQKYAGIMPEADSSIYSSVKMLDAQIQETVLGLREAESRSQSLQGQIDTLLNKSSDADAVSGMSTDPLDTRIKGLESRLDELLLQFTEQHPDVVSTRRVLEQLKKQRQEQKDSDKDTGNVSSDMLGSTLYGELNVLLGQAQAEISALRARLSEYQKRREEMNEVIQTLPTIEAQLASLNRDYEVTRELYQNLVMRRESSQLTYKAEQTGEDLQFRILEPPLVPVSPASPNRILLETVVLIASIAIGIGLAIVYEQIRPTFYTKRQLNNLVDLPVVGFVSMYMTDREIRRRRIGVAIFISVASVWLISYLGLLIHNGLMAGLISQVLG